MTGTIKRLVRDRGFGFITDSSNGKEYFFHRTGVRGNFDSLTEGQAVTYEEEPSVKGARATNVSAR